MRERLPDRRDADLIAARHMFANGNKLPLILTVGRYADGRIGEVFVDFPIDMPGEMKSGDMALLMNDFATLISIALQHGATVDELRAATGRTEVNWMGEQIERPHTIAGSILDALSREPGKTDEAAE